MHSRILLQTDRGIARITLNRPEKRNALDALTITEIGEALASTAADESVRVVVIAGAGADFCSGADLSGLQQMETAGVMQNMADARKMADVFVAMRRHPRPILAAVRGRALAGGCGLATACDLILASDTAKFGYPEVNIGFVAAMVMAILRRSLSEKRAFELVVGGEIITSETAFDYGLVNRVFADESFNIEVEAFASKMAAKSASAVALSKHLLYHMDQMSFEAAIEAGVQTNAIARTTDDMKRGLEKFLNKKSG